MYLNNALNNEDNLRFLDRSRFLDRLISTKYNKATIFLSYYSEFKPAFIIYYNF